MIRRHGSGAFTMIDPSAFARGFALSAALIVAIGAQNMFVLRQGLRREHVGPIVLFCAACDALLITAGVTGLGMVLRLVPGLALILSLGGASFLAWYGATALRRATQPDAMILSDQAAAMPLGATLGRAAGFTLLNPHVYLDTVLLMGTVGSSQAAGTQPIFIAGAASASVIWFTSLGYGARLLTPLFARPMAWRVLDLLVGLTMLGLALGLLMHLVRG
ncbi:LysE/ArgO family amino acid transporter [Flavisphingomonas formosensis]|uniref:LysE/ArgO family amino acid transporter n=1 Tax=Flavisphingomonas formosensis TaxID=861534 RepID=UPI001E59D727|nr:LysE/ArgO family amino acid transporter [Sphingomonas formosensis]